MVIGHSTNKAACVAITAAVQTFANIANQLCLLAKDGRLENGTEESEPLYEVQLIPGEQTAAVLDGVVASFRGILSVVPGCLEIADARKRNG
jgi:hypothetical protein